MGGGRIGRWIIARRNGAGGETRKESAGTEEKSPLHPKNKTSGRRGSKTTTSTGEKDDTGQEESSSLSSTLKLIYHPPLLQQHALLNNDNGDEEEEGTDGWLHQVVVDQTKTARTENATTTTECQQRRLKLALVEAAAFLTDETLCKDDVVDLELVSQQMVHRGFPPLCDSRNNTPLHRLLLLKTNCCCPAKEVVSVVMLMVLRSYPRRPRALTITNFDMETPLHILCKRQKNHESSSSSSVVAADDNVVDPLVQLLVQANPKALEMVNGDYETPLHLLVKSNAASSSLATLRYVVGQYPIASLFLDQNGKFPFECCCYNNSASLSSSSVNDGRDDDDDAAAEAKMIFLRRAFELAVLALLKAAEYRRVSLPEPVSVEFKRLLMICTTSSSSAERTAAAAALETNQTVRQWLDCSPKCSDKIERWNCDLSDWIEQRSGLHALANDLLRGVNLLLTGGRRRHDSSSSVEELVVAANHNLDCLFLHLRENPLLVVYCRG